MRSSPAGTVTLMPFLAVLLCTMGALIMLLLVVAKDVRDQQSAALTTPNGADDTARALAALKSATEETEWLTEQYRLAQESVNDELKLQQATLAFLESQTRKRLEEAAALARALEAIRAGNVLRQSRETLEAALAERQSQLAAATKQLSELRAKSASANKSYAIVPTLAANGTHRRPMFIECRDNTVILQPEGIVLTDVDFLMAGRPESPLNCALRSLQQYLAESGGSEEPYPLVVIRPSGAAIFPAVRASLGGWVSDYGYEIVDEDWNIQYPNPNPEIQQRLESQVTSARQRLLAWAAQQREEELRASQSGGTYRVGRGGVVERVDSRAEMGTAGSAQRGGGGNATSGPKIAARTAAATEQGSGTDTNSTNAAPRDGEQTSTARGTPNANGRESSPTSQNETAQQTANVETHDGVRVGQGRPQKTAGPQEFPDVAPHQLYADNTAGATARQTYSQQQARDNWGLNDASDNATPIVRSIRVVCDKTRLSLPQQAGLIRKRDIPLDISTPAASNAAMEAFVREIWDFMETWGIAGSNKYWRPILNVTVASGAENEFAVFCQHLERSGFVIKRQ